jgi:4-hydroxybenzoate polyprenyltransferase
MKILKIVRSNEWWDAKLPPLLALGFATAFKADVPILDIVSWLCILLLSIIVGAAFVSIINDLTDIEEDLASGKSNRMAGVSPRLRWIVPVVCILAGCGFLYVFYPDYLSCFLYILPWISFSLYSFEPFRLKRRGIWGVFADASGSHIFISLLIISSISFYIKSEISWTWFASVAIWAFAYGLRGILWHQFVDRENDLVANVNTFATHVNPIAFKKVENCIFFVELFALSIFLLYTGSIWPVVFLLFYVFLVWIRLHKMGQRPVIIVSDSTALFQILMLDYYSFLLPVSLILASSFCYSSDFIVLALFILLFPKTPFSMTKDVLRYLFRLLPGRV